MIDYTKHITAVTRFSINTPHIIEIPGGGMKRMAVTPGRDLGGLGRSRQRWDKIFLLQGTAQAEFLRLYRSRPSEADGGHQGEREFALKKENSEDINRSDLQPNCI